jgi:hypothetical protein
MLPTEIERYLAAVSNIYAQEGARDLQQIIVNAQVQVIEDWTSDNWNGGTFGHAIYLRIADRDYSRHRAQAAGLSGPCSPTDAPTIAAVPIRVP